MNGNGRRLSQLERAMEYVDSPRMTQRIKLGDLLSCRIYGNYGIYLTRASIEREDFSCPSEYQPCKHVNALRITYHEVPDSFLIVDELLNELKKKKKSELLDIIHEMIVTEPQMLSVLGIEGFEMDEEDEDEDEDYDYDEDEDDDEEE